MDDDVHVLDQRRDGVAVENVATAVEDLPPAPRRRIEGAPGHAEDASDLARALERGDDRPPDLAGGAGHRGLQARPPPPALRPGDLCIAPSRSPPLGARLRRLLR